MIFNLHLVTADPAFFFRASETADPLCSMMYLFLQHDVNCTNPDAVVSNIQFARFSTHLVIADLLFLHHVVNCTKSDCTNFLIDTDNIYCFCLNVDSIGFSSGRFVENYFE